MPHRQAARKVTVATAIGVIAVLATAAVSYVIVERVRIGSDEFDRALLFNNVVLDTTPPPATLSDSYLLNISLLEATPQQIEESARLLQQAEDAYDASIERWTGELTEAGGPDSDAALALLDDLSGPADEFWRLSDDVVLPAVRSGDLATALDTVFGPMQVAFSAHHDVGDQILTDLVAAQARQEDRTTSFVEDQRTIAIVFVACVCAALVLAGAWMRIRLTRSPAVAVDHPAQPGPSERPERDDAMLVDAGTS